MSSRDAGARRVGCSSEAQELIARMSADQRSRTDPWTVADVRADLHAAFAPRHRRALKTLSADLSHIEFGGVRCLVVEPRRKTSEDTVLYFFGGGFISGSPEFELPLVARLCELTRLRIVLPYYALAPEQPYPRQLEEALSVYAALSATTSGRIILSGESAGGGLALSVAHEITERHLPEPAALCLFSPWVDLTERDHQACEDIDDPSIDVDLLKLAAAMYCSSNAPYEISPAYARPTLPRRPIYISTGTRDIMRPSLERFAMAQIDKGLPIDLKVWEGMWHVFELYDEIPEAEIALTYAANFITSALLTQD